MIHYYTNDLIMRYDMINSCDYSFQSFVWLSGGYRIPSIFHVHCFSYIFFHSLGISYPDKQYSIKITNKI